jgi:multidrug efflux pump subunit AcrA (membrane-fusion protein)
MAEIRVEPKRRSLAWLWVLLALAALAALFWWFNNNGVDEVNTAPATTAPTSLAPAPASTPLTPTVRVA